MTIQELYVRMDGNYDHALRIMKSERLIDKYVRKLKSSGLDAMLAEAGEAMDPVKLFESAHAMKGVCANLGLDQLAADADAITEEFRPGKARRLTDDQVRAKIDAAVEKFRATVQCIREYEESA